MRISCFTSIQGKVGTKCCTVRLCQTDGLAVIGAGALTRGASVVRVFLMVLARRSYYPGNIFRSLSELRINKITIDVLGDQRPHKRCLRPGGFDASEKIALPVSTMRRSSQ